MNKVNMQKLIKSGLYSLVILTTACASESVVIENPNAIQFVVIGDTPYSEADEEMLAEAVPLIRDRAYPFVIHVGDYKGGRAECLAVHDEAHAELIADLRPIPVFYTPGDNEWTDCDRNINPETGERYSDLEQLANIRKRMSETDLNVPSKFNFVQDEQMPENQTWQYRAVRFVSLHVTGTNNGRDWVTGDPHSLALAAVKFRDDRNRIFAQKAFELARAENAEAVVIAMQADLTDIAKKPEDVMCTTVAASDNHDCDAFTDLRFHIQSLTKEFDGPVLLIHGDTAPFTLNQNFAGEEADNLWILNAAGDKGPTYGVRDVTHVEIDLTQARPFSARGLISDARPRKD